MHLRWRLRHWRAGLSSLVADDSNACCAACPHLWPLPATGCTPAAAGRGKGGPQAHPAGTRGALPATRWSRHPRSAGKRSDGRLRPASIRSAVAARLSPRRGRRLVVTPQPTDRSVPGCAELRGSLLMSSLGPPDAVGTSGRGGTARAGFVELAQSAPCQHHVSRTSVEDHQQPTASNCICAGRRQCAANVHDDQPSRERFPKPCAAGSNPAGGTTGRAGRRLFKPPGRPAPRCWTGLSPRTRPHEQVACPCCLGKLPLATQQSRTGRWKLRDVPDGIWSCPGARSERIRRSSPGR